MSDGKKDLWDILNILATLLIASMVAYWGYSNDKANRESAELYNSTIASLEAEKNKIAEEALKFEKLRVDLEMEFKKQQELTKVLNEDENQLTRKLAVVQTLIPHLSHSPESRKAAIITLSKLGANDIALEFASLYEDKSSKEAGDRILQHGTSIEQVLYPKEITSSAQGNNVRLGWIYLGRRKGDKWVGNYVELRDTWSLDQLDGKVVKVKEGVTGLNVRTGTPSWLGALEPVQDLLMPQSQIKLSNKTHTTFKDYVWMQVEYSLPEG